MKTFAKVLDCDDKGLSLVLPERSGVSSLGLSFSEEELDDDDDDDDSCFLEFLILNRNWVVGSDDYVK